MSGIQSKGQHNQSGITIIFHAYSGIQRDNVQPPSFLEGTYTRGRLMIGLWGIQTNGQQFVSHHNGA